MEILINLIAIVVVVLLFNFMIFIHELGHFLAAKWRGLKVEKFYIWFGKPLWKKTIGGVEYGIGSIPAGGYVALPQMAPMEAIEGGDSELRKELPPITPLDKIIVAFAGPLFSFLLAFTAACAVWVFGKPADTIHTTTVGYVEAGSPSEKAGFELGDRILAVDGEKVDRYMGGMDGLKEKIMLSRKDPIDIQVERNGTEQTLTTSFEVDKTPWYKRNAMRRIGVGYDETMVVEHIEKKSPAAAAGLQLGDVVESLDGEEVFSVPQLGVLLKEKLGATVTLQVKRGESQLAIQVDSVVPNDKNTGKPHPKGNPMIGVGFERPYDLSLIKPNPAEQVQEGVVMMYKTIQAITAPKSNVGIQHLSGPIGIGTAMFSFIRTDEAVRRIFWFMVVLNINLAIMNMLPLPVLDGGHIVLAIGEQIAGKPVKLRLLEIIQTGFVAVLLSLFVYITSKDIADLPIFGKEDPWGKDGFVWPTLEASEPSLETVPAVESE